MSLDVSLQLLAEAENGEVREEDFVETVRTSLPYAYNLVDRLVGELLSGAAEFADNQTPPPSEKERGQLLRAVQRCDPRQPGTALRHRPRLPELPPGGRLPP